LFCRVTERLTLLAAAGVPTFDPVAERKRHGPSALAIDDIVDAAAMLLTATHVARGSAARLPPEVIERDERGLAMDMWTPSGPVV
jgi:predicted RNase H-like nuclease